MTLVRTTQREHRHEAAKLFLVTIAVVGLAAGCNMATETATGSSGPFYKITPDFKDSSTFAAGTSLSVPIHVTYNGAAIVSAPVHWGVLSGHGVISDTISTTDTLGTTRVVWTLGAAPDTNVLVVAVGDAVDTLHVTGTVGAPSYLDLVGARSDTISAGQPVTLAVVVRDRPGNGVPGATVNWATSGGNLSISSAVSNGTGTATVSFTANQPGTYSVTAGLPERAALFFEIVVH